MNQPNRAAVTTSTLYIVPTPIGNLGDITQRALDVLSHVDLIAAEDTRHTGLLLQHFAINARLYALHDHNEQQKADQLISKLQQGLSIALVSDAGTPLINDPGYHLVNQCRKNGINVVPLPGACLCYYCTVCGRASIRSFLLRRLFTCKNKKSSRLFTVIIRRASYIDFL